MTALRAVALLMLALAGIAEDGQSAADRAYGEGVAAFERAQAADALGRADDAKRELVTARAQLDDAIARYRALIAGSRAAQPDAERRLADAETTGKVCCGKTSLWKKYGVESAAGRDQAPTAAGR